MKIELLGWLTKGQMNVSLMDKMIMVFEFIILVPITCLAIVGLEKIYKKFYTYDWTKKKWVRK